MALTNFTKPNINSAFFIGSPMELEPTNVNQFAYDFTEAKHGTLTIEMSSDFNTDSREIYGVKEAVEYVLGVTRSFSVTMMVNVDNSSGSLYTRLRTLSYDPLNSDYNKISYLVRGIDPATGQPIPGDYFCPEANIKVDGTLDFGTAGEMREITVEITNLLDADLLDGRNIPGTAPTPPIEPVISITNDTVTYVSPTDASNTFGDLQTDAGITADEDGTDVSASLRYIINGVTYSQSDTIPPLVHGERGTYTVGIKASGTNGSYATSSITLIIEGVGTPAGGLSMGTVNSTDALFTYDFQSNGNPVSNARIDLVATATPSTPIDTISPLNDGIANAGTFTGLTPSTDYTINMYYDTTLLDTATFTTPALRSAKSTSADNKSTSADNKDTSKK